MDTKTLVVGQDVYMVSGPYYGTKVKVVRIEPSGCVVVQLPRFAGPTQESSEARGSLAVSSPPHRVNWMRPYGASLPQLTLLHFVELLVDQHCHQHQ